MSSFAGWALFIVNLSLPALSRQVRERPGIAASLYFTIACHQAVSLLQVYFRPLPTINADAVAFNRFAMGLLDSWNYEQIPYIAGLREIYRYLGASHLLGCQISQLGFVVALLVFLELLKLLKADSRIPQLILLFGCLPSCILQTSAVQREAWQIAMFLTANTCLLHFFLRGPSWRIVAAVVAALSLAFLHKGLCLLTLCLLPLALYWASRPHGLQRPTLLLLVLGSLAILPLLLPKLIAYSTVLQMAVKGNLTAYVDNYAEQVNDSRTSFGVTLDLSSPYRLARTAPKVVAMYLFAPFPWQIRDLKDAYGLFESLARILLLLFVVKTLRKERRQEHFFLFSVALLTELLWSAGTANWGTAFRHRLIAYPLFVAIGGSSLFQWLEVTPALARLQTRRERRPKELNS